jgi:hypothetical protein
MRYRRKFTHSAKTEEAEPLLDASGNVWNPELYRVDEAGEPLLTSSGNYWLKPGKSHPEAEESEASE